MTKYTAWEALTVDGKRPQWVWAEGNVFHRHWVPNVKGAPNRWHAGIGEDPAFDPANPTSSPYNPDIWKVISFDGEPPTGDKLPDGVSRKVRDQLLVADVQRIGALDQLIDDAMADWQAQKQAAAAAAAAVPVAAPAAPVQAAPTQTTDSSLMPVTMAANGMTVMQLVATPQPPEAYADYVPVQLGTRVRRDAFDVLDEGRKHQLNIRLTSATGVGKSYLISAYAALNGLPFYKISYNGTTNPDELAGAWWANAQGTGYTLSKVVYIIRFGGVLLLDEFQFADANVDAFFHPLLDSSREISIPALGETFKAHPDLLIVAADNPVEYAGSKLKSPAALDRFDVQFTLDYDEELEAKLVPFDRIRRVAKKVRANDSDFRTPFSTRMLVSYHKQAQLAGPDWAADLLINRFDPYGEQAALEQIIRAEVGDASDFYGDHFAKADDDLDIDIDLVF